MDKKSAFNTSQPVLEVLTIEGHAAFEYQKIFTNALKTAYLNLSENFDQEKIAQKNNAFGNVSNTSRGIF